MSCRSIIGPRKLTSGLRSPSELFAEGNPPPNVDIARLCADILRIEPNREVFFARRPSESGIPIMEVLYGWVFFGQEPT